MCKMIMIEDGNMNIQWECSNCNAVFNDEDGFEKKVSCPNCNDSVDEFVNLFDEDGNYA